MACEQKSSGCLFETHLKGFQGSTAVMFSRAITAVVISLRILITEVPIVEHSKRSDT